MIMISYSKLTNISMLLLEDASIFFDYFEVGEDVCNTVYLFRSGHQVAIIRFDKGIQFMHCMGSLS